MKCILQFLGLDAPLFDNDSNNDINGDDKDDGGDDDDDEK